MLNEEEESLDGKDDDNGPDLAEESAANVQCILGSEERCFLRPLLTQLWGIFHLCLLFCSPCTT